MDSFLVTGGAGFIGSNICRRLVEQGLPVRVVDNLVTGRMSNLADIIDKIDFIEADMGDETVAKNAMDGIDVVLHQGAIPSVPKSLTDPVSTHKNCVDATFTLLMAAKEARIKRFVYAASSSAYGDSEVLPKVETMVTKPLSPYAAAKLVGEYYCNVFSGVFGLETISLRYFNVFGPYQDPTSEYAAAIPAFVTSILKGVSPTVYGDGEQSRDFTYIDNIVHANLLAADAEKTSGEVVNIACGDCVTINEIIGLINDLTGNDVKISYEDRRVGDVMHSTADIRLAKQVIGFEPICSFSDGLKKAIAWYAENLM